MLIVIYNKLAEHINMKEYHKPLKKLSPQQLLTNAEKKAIKKREAAAKAERNGPKDGKFEWRPKAKQGQKPVEGKSIKKAEAKNEKKGAIFVWQPKKQQ